MQGHAERQAAPDRGFLPVLVPGYSEDALERSAENLSATSTRMRLLGCAEATKHQDLELLKTPEDFQYLLFCFNIYFFQYIFFFQYLFLLGILLSPTATPHLFLTQPGSPSPFRGAGPAPSILEPSRHQRCQRGARGAQGHSDQRRSSPQQMGKEKGKKNKIKSPQTLEMWRNAALQIGVPMGNSFAASHKNPRHIPPLSSGMVWAPFVKKSQRRRETAANNPGSVSNAAACGNLWQPTRRRESREIRQVFLQEKKFGAKHIWVGFVLKRSGFGRKRKAGKEKNSLLVSGQRGSWLYPPARNRKAMGKKGQHVSPVATSLWTPLGTKGDEGHGRSCGTSGCARGSGTGRPCAWRARTRGTFPAELGGISAR